MKFFLLPLDNTPDGAVDRVSRRAAEGVSIPVKRFYEFIQRRDKERKEDGEPRSSAIGNFVEQKE